MSRVKKTIWLLSLACTLGAWSWWSTTWGSQNTEYLPDGAVCVSLVALDGGFGDGGWGTDGGFADGGWGFDAGPPGNLDGGPLDGGYQDGGPGDGGWFQLGFGAGTFGSDKIYSSTVLAGGCYVTTPIGIGPPAANVSIDLIGSPMQNPVADGGLWSPYPNTTQTCATADGGSCYMSFTEGLPGLMPYSAVQILSNYSDAGLLCCPTAAQ
jgi:hypothetical protein